jgi:hypothetical protein
MFSFFTWKKRTKCTRPVALNADIRSYLERLYAESRQILFRILLGEALPNKEPFPLDPDRTMEILSKIEALIANDSHLNHCRKKIVEGFPGELAVMFNLAPRPSSDPSQKEENHSEDPQDHLLSNEELRKAIREHVRRHEASLIGEPFEKADLDAMQDLKGSSRLQQQLAYLVNYTPSKWLLEQEIPVVLESRQRRLHGVRPRVSAQGKVALDETSVLQPVFTRGQDAYEWSGSKAGRLRGLCLSGGGIRSATFNLGVLQGLAKKNLLRRFDYLSSVSGGGYIHQWFAAWVKREEKSLPRTAGTPGLDAVCRQMIPLPDKGCAPQPPEAIRWLRRFSNYLTPEVGFFSADTWVTVATWMRNTSLNQLVLISFLTMLLLLPHLLLLPSTLPGIAQPSTARISGIHDAILNFRVSGLLFLLVGINYFILVWQIFDGLSNARKGAACVSRLDDFDVCLRIVVPALVISVFTSDFAFYFKPFGNDAVMHMLVVCGAVFLGLLLLALAITIAGGAMNRPKFKDKPSTKRIFGFTLAAIFAALAGAAVLLLARNTFVYGNPVQFEPKIAQSSAPVSPHVHLTVSKADSQQVNLTLQIVNAPTSAAATKPNEADPGWRRVLVFGPFVIIMIPFLTIILLCGLIGSDFQDWVLEWLARLRAWVMLHAISWSVLVGISLFGHQLIQMLIDNGYSWINWTAIGGWALTTAGSVLAGKSSSTSGEPGSSASPRWMSILIKVGPPAYILGLLLALSWATQELLVTVGISNHPVSRASLAEGLLVFLVPAIIFALFGWRVDINEFSMHAYYRNRLARCYLGASNIKRDPDPLTGFDPKDVDELTLSSFLPSQGYSGPLPIFCATLNISVGEDLAWQERKAASFAFTPVLSGYYVPWTGDRYSGELSFNGFVPTERFAYHNGGVHISTVTAVSGAAVSPDWGYHTSPSMAFLLTMFNVRLGWWLPNPRRSFLAFDPTGQVPNDQQEFPRPRFAPWQLLQELLGRIGDDQEFAYLTDGGHFDNMGLYELVRRRCYEIVICDAEQDNGPIFDGIGMAVRKCRIDFGAEIVLDLTKMAKDATTKVHWVTGTIRYPETGDGEEGTILYIKTSIVGNETADVYNYLLDHPTFPQDSTANQWFTESQFESYRRLGQQVVDKCPYL